MLELSNYMLKLSTNLQLVRVSKKYASYPVRYIMTECIKLCFRIIFQINRTPKFWFVYVKKKNNQVCGIRIFSYTHITNQFLSLLGSWYLRPWLKLLNENGREYSVLNSYRLLKWFYKPLLAFSKNTTFTNLSNF